MLLKLARFNGRPARFSSVVARQRLFSSYSAVCSPTKEVKPAGGVFSGTMKTEGSAAHFVTGPAGEGVGGAGLPGGLKGTAGSTVGTAHHAAKNAAGDAKGAVDSAADGVRETASQAETAVSDAASKAKTAASDAFSQAEAAASDAASKAKAAASDVASSASDAASQAKTAASDAASQAKDAASDAASQAKTAASDAASQAKDAASDVHAGAKDLAGDARDTAAKTSAQVKDVAEEVKEAASSAATTAKDSVASTAKETATSIKKTATRTKHRLRNTLLLLSAGVLVLYASDSRASIYSDIALPALMYLTENDPEEAHELAIRWLATGIAPRDTGTDDPVLALELWGRELSNPIGLAAGFDKHGHAIDTLHGLGFAYVEIGSVTPQPQPGNPKPRVFRVPALRAIVNRYGFNSEGLDVVEARLRRRVERFVRANSLDFADAIPPPPENAVVSRFDGIGALLASPAGAGAALPDAIGSPRALSEGRVLAVNVSKNKYTPNESTADFEAGIRRLGPYADVLVVNISSPNTPGLRDLQHRAALETLLSSVVGERDALASPRPPVLVKIAPDLTADGIADVAAAALATGVDGIIVSNTTVSRPAETAAAAAAAGSYNSSTLAETGGLSGPPVKPLALSVLRQLYSATEGKLPLVGCGGISSADDALEFARAGASMVQVYTAFIYEGVGLPRKIKDDLTQKLKAEGKRWTDYIGADVKAAVEKDAGTSGNQPQATAPPTEPKESHDDTATATKDTSSQGMDNFKQLLAETEQELVSLFKEVKDAAKESGDTKPLLLDETLINTLLQDGGETDTVAPSSSAIDAAEEKK